MGRHQQPCELAWVRWWVGRLGDESLEQTARGHQCSLELRGDRLICSRCCVDRAQQPSVVAIERNLTRHDRRDQVVGRASLNLVDERVLAVRQQVRCHLGEIVEVAVEDGPRHACLVHHVSHGQCGERSITEQLPGSGQDAAPRLVGRNACGSLRHGVANGVILRSDMLSQSESSLTITLPDERTLSYLLAGADEGPAVAVLDGPCSRGLGRALAPTARDLGIRLLIPDRPGALGSTPQSERRIADWPADHRALLDALGVERAGVLAQSGGTPYGIAVAAADPERTTGLVLFGALAPLIDRAARREAGRQLRTGAFLARHLPSVLRAGLKRAAKKLPDSAVALLPEHERRFLDDPWLRDIHLRTSAEILSNPDAMIDEIRLLARPWEITVPPAGAVPTALWTGDLDTTHPPSHARRVAALLGGNPPVTIVPGAATFGLIDVFPDALRIAAAL